MMYCSYFSVNVKEYDNSKMEACHNNLANKWIFQISSVIFKHIFRGNPEFAEIKLK